MTRFTVHSFPLLDSTMKMARDSPPGTVIVAEEQTGGRGRFNRTWHADKGGLWLSAVFEPRRKLFEYTFIAALAVLENVQKLGVRGACVKWPNDVMVKGKKLCGILSEGVFSGNTAEKIVVGVGVNVNNAIREEIKDIAISIKDIMRRDIDLKKLRHDILEAMESLESRPTQKLLLLYRQHCGMLGKTITARTMHGTVSGTAEDIDDEGNLILKQGNKLTPLREGDVTISGKI